MNWRVKLNDVDITAYCSGVETRFEADAICGEVEVALASRAPIAGIIVPRVPRELSLQVDELVDGTWTSRGAYYLEQITTPQDINARTATIWGRSASASLTTPWAQKISKQWSAATTIAAIVSEVAALCGVTVTVTNDFSVCQYCYVASDQYPSEIIRDLAEKSGQILWPQVDGSLVIAPRAYTYGTPDVTLDAGEIVIESVDRTAPDFGNRVRVSSAGAVSGITVTVVPMSDDACVAADGASTVRLIAVVTGSDGAPVALGTDVTWSASGGLMTDDVTRVALVQRSNEAVRATDYYHVSLGLPAESVIGVYARSDLLKKTNLYALRSGSVSGTVITFGQSLDYYDQSLVIDYMVQGAPNEWTAGWSAGDVTVFASAAGASGQTIIHQSNPTACPTQVTLAASSSSPCLGDAVTITLRAIMFGGAALGTAIFSLSGCGTLSASRKTLTEHEVTETLRTSVWGGVSEIKLTAVPVAGSSVSVVLASNPGSNLYAAHTGQTVQLNTVLEAGTQVTATYSGGGTAKVTWTPSALPEGLEHIDEWLYTTHAEVDGVTVGQVELSRTPASSSTPICVPLSSNDDYFSSRDAKVITLIDDPFTGDPLPVGTYIRCTYDCVWSQQPDCVATITANVQDGSEDGGVGSITVTADDCRTVTGSDDYDPDDDTQTEETGETDDTDEDTDEDDDTDFDPEEDAEDQPSPTGCTALDINARISAVTAANIAAVAGVGSVDDCPGLCTCDQICDALRSSGKLGSAGLFYSQCVKSCTDTRAQKCTPCALSGPDTLAPGAEGTWTDGKGNSGEWQQGPVTLKSRTFDGGYVATMPTGGTGPFTVKVCYGANETQCCETQVSYPDCYLTGPSELAPGAEAEYKPSLGMAGATITGTMEEVRKTETAFVMRHKSGACSGWLSVSYGGQLCGMMTVGSTLSGDSMAATGPTTMSPGEQGYFAVATTSGNYDGLTLADAGGMTVVQQAGQGWILRMPDGATGSRTLTWTASCGRSASVTVAVAPNPVTCTGYVAKSCYSGIGDVGVCPDGVVRQIGESITGVLPVNPAYRPSSCEWFWNGGGFFDHYFDDYHAQRHAGIVICTPGS